MKRGKSAPQPTTSKSSNEVPGADIRAMCRRVSPYIIHQWRCVCEVLGVPDASLNQLEARHEHLRPSELAFQGLCLWHDRIGKAASREKLRRALHLFGLKRAEAELEFMDGKRMVPCLARSHHQLVNELPANVQAKQKALADRLSRPKSTASEGGSDHKKKAESFKAASVNPLGLQITPAKPNEICEVKFKITVRGVQRHNQDDVQLTKDDFSSTKDDYKHTCHTFVRLVMTNQRTHFRELRELLGFQGISVTRLNRIGFNVNVFILCFTLGSFEILYQAYSTGRLKHLIQTSLVPKRYLEKLNVQQVDLSITMEENMVNKYRDILLVRGVGEHLDGHPADLLDNWQPQTDNGVGDDAQDESSETEHEFDLELSQGLLDKSIDALQERYRLLSEAVNDLLMTLRIAKPANTNDMATLQDMLDNYHFLRRSKNVRSGVRTDLLCEYLSIVNHIRLEIVNLRNNEVYIAFDETLDPTVCEHFCRLLEDTEAMLEPTFPFQTDNKGSSQTLAGMDRETFGGLLCYIPALLVNLTCLCEFLNSTITPDDDIPDEEVDASSNVSQTEEPDEYSEEVTPGVSKDPLVDKPSNAKSKETDSITNDNTADKERKSSTENGIKCNVHIDSSNHSVKMTTDANSRNDTVSEINKNQSNRKQKSIYNVRFEAVDRNNGCV